MCELPDCSPVFPMTPGPKPRRPWPRAQPGASGLPSPVPTPGEKASWGSQYGAAQSCFLQRGVLSRSERCKGSPAHHILPSACSTTWTHPATSATTAQPCRGPRRGPRWPTAAVRRSSSLCSTSSLRTSTSCTKSTPTTCPMGTLTSRSALPPSGPRGGGQAVPAQGWTGGAESICAGLWPCGRRAC